MSLCRRNGVYILWCPTDARPAIRQRLGYPRQGGQVQRRGRGGRGGYGAPYGSEVCFNGTRLANVLDVSLCELCACVPIGCGGVGVCSDTTALVHMLVYIPFLALSSFIYI
jgi:hypothetical protein